MPYDFDWVDAFSAVPFGGNGCVVVHGAQDLAVEQRLALVNETSLAECAFVVPSSVAHFGARYYLADREIPMAGHPTIATVASLVDRGMVEFDGSVAKFTLELPAGVLPIEVRRDEQGALITMTQLRPSFGATYAPKMIADMYGLQEAEILGEPQVVSTGTPFCVTLLRDKQALRRAKLDYDQLEAFRAASERADAQLMEPFLVTLGGFDKAGDTFSRLLLAPPSLPEDPFTGSATGCMAAYLWKLGLIESRSFRAQQGHWMGRPGEAQVELLGAREAIEGVRVGGYGRVLMRGQLMLG